MTLAARRHARHAVLASFVFPAFLAFMIGGCAAPPPPPPPPSNVELPFEQAVAQASEGLMAQVRLLPSYKRPSGKQGTVLDPMIDATTGQQTAATRLLEQRVTERLGAGLDGIDILPFKTANLAAAPFLLTGTLSRALPDRPKGSMLINLALTELKTGKVAAQSWALARDDTLDLTPLPYYADSPVLVRDKAIEGYVTTSATVAGKPANPYYLERIAAAAVINDANVLYNSEKYQEALSRYRAAASEPGGDQLRVLNGIYLASVKLGKGVEAEQSFAKIVAYGLANNQLDVKFLFNPGSTVFWSDARVSGPYAMWLRQIARESTAAKACMSIVGHTSKTGSEPANEVLSLQRASFIRQRLISEAALLAGRTKPSGMGARENIVGSGTDNAVDALDRRVEFRIVPCA